MSRCQTYLEHIGYLPPLQGVKHRQLIAGEAVTLRNCLQDDGGNSLYSAAVSLADALRGLRDGFYTWATVKLYYAVFYTARCELALRDIALFYIGGKPCTILTSAGATLAPQKGTTHEVVLDQFSRLFPNSPFSQTIDGKPPLTWLRERRENANYKNARFVEPNDPTHFRGVVTEGVRRATLAYLSPTGLTTYSFDPEHAMLAFPLRFWRDAVSEARAAGLPDTIADEVDFLSKAFSDGSGPLSEIIRVIA